MPRPSHLQEYLLNLLMQGGRRDGIKERFAFLANHLRRASSLACSAEREADEINSWVLGVREYTSIALEFGIYLWKVSSIRLKRSSSDFIPDRRVYGTTKGRIGRSDFKRLS